MDLRKYGDTWYIRMDKGDEIIGTLLATAKKEHIDAAVFTGIGGCGEAEIQTYIPEEQDFETEKLTGMLELVSLTGNLLMNENGELMHHTHGLFTYKDADGTHRTAGGHLKSVTVLYTAEIELRPVRGGKITKKYDPETKTGFWEFCE